MTRYLLDTDTYSEYLRHRASVHAAVFKHIQDEVAISIITVQEIWQGWQAAIARAKNPERLSAVYDRLAATIAELSHWPIQSFPLETIARYSHLKKQKLNVSASDLKIASIALATGAILVTHNVRDFQRIPDLPIEDWVASQDSEP